MLRPRQSSECSSQDLLQDTSAPLHPAGHAPCPPCHLCLSSQLYPRLNTCDSRCECLFAPRQHSSRQLGQGVPCLRVRQDGQCIEGQIDVMLRELCGALQSLRGLHQRQCLHVTRLSACAACARRARQERTLGTSPSPPNLRRTISPMRASAGASCHAKSTGAVAMPRRRSAPPEGLPNAADVERKSSMSSTSCKHVASATAMAT